MTGFSDQWLALREPADHAARGPTLLNELVSCLSDRTSTRAKAGLSVLDLGAGTGSNLRHLAPHLGHDQRWCLVDNDQRLLAPTRDRLTQWAARTGATLIANADSWQLDAPDFSATISLLSLDLATDIDKLPWHQVDLLTGSALLDLVSRAWLTKLATHCQRQQCLALFALTYDGRMQWSPSLPHDQEVIAALNRHQQRDKGFGPAMGPLAAQASIDCFAAHGFTLQQAQTDWVLRSDSVELQQELTTGVAGAIVEIEALTSSQAKQWLSTRLAHLQSDEAQLTVGHVDWLAVPEPT